MASPNADPAAARRPVVTMLPGAAGRQRAIAWANAHVGLPYGEGAEGPDAWSCWPLVQAGLRDLASIELPHAPIGEMVSQVMRRAIRRDWRPSPTLQHMAICLTSSSRAPRHVGLAMDLDGGVIVHALEGAGVIVSTPLQMRCMGFQRLRYAVYSPDSDLPAAVAA